MKILIIGGIAAGMSTAAKARRENKEAHITVVEMEDYISFGACGLPYYLGGQFTDENEMFARSVQQMQDQGINILTKHKAVALNTEEKCISVENLQDNSIIQVPYDRLMIATGASPILPPIEHIHADNVYTMTKLDAVKKLRDNLDQYETIGVVGGGFIGIEIAEQLAKLNKKIKLIHSPKVLMNYPFDLELSMKIEEAMKDVGVEVITGQRVQRMDAETNLVTKLHTQDYQFDVDAVVYAVGFKPNTDFLKGHLDMMDNGAIYINQYGQTSQEDIFAAGDCATIPHKFLGDQYIPLATYANKMGRIIGTNIVKDQSHWLSYKDVLGTSAVKAGHYEAVVTGITEKDAIAIGLDIRTTLIETNNHPSYYPNQEPILIKLVYDAQTHVLYGAQMFGKNDTVLRATGYTTAIHAGLKTEDIGFIDYAYSPPFSSTWEALNVAANTAK